ncbi:MAG: outer membrane beta-barrel domain-containing protein [Gammaproteobacteria bacterium]
MATRLCVLLLISLLATGCSMFRRDKAPDSDEPELVVSGRSGQTQVIDPEVERREITVPKVDTEDFEVGAFAGYMSVEDFGANPVIGATFAYHITEKWFIEAGVGTTDTEETSFEVLSGGAQLLSDSERRLTYYNLSMGYNVLPGEAFTGKRRAFTQSLYLIAGLGSTEFGGDDHFTVNFGLGYTLLPKDWFAVRFDFRNHMFDSELIGVKKTTNNLEFTLGVTFFF